MIDPHFEIIWDVGTFSAASSDICLIRALDMICNQLIDVIYVLHRKTLTQASGFLFPLSCAHLTEMRTDKKKRRRDKMCST